jgi:hypothetical protein
MGDFERLCQNCSKFGMQHSAALRQRMVDVELEWSNRPVRCAVKIVAVSGPDFWLRLNGLMCAVISGVNDNSQREVGCYLVLLVSMMPVMPMILHAGLPPDFLPPIRQSESVLQTVYKRCV